MPQPTIASARISMRPPLVANDCEHAGGERRSRGYVLRGLLPRTLQLGLVGSSVDRGHIELLHAEHRPHGPIAAARSGSRISSANPAGTTCQDRP